MSDGSEFHAVSPLCEKGRSPNVVRKIGANKNTLVSSLYRVAQKIVSC